MCLFYGYMHVMNLSPPLRGRDRVCIVRQVGERFAGNLELMISTRPRTDLPLARVPECLIRLRGRQKSVCGNVHV